MSTLTIHALDPMTEKRIRVKARKEKKSLNQILKELLSGAVGVSAPSCSENHRAEFQEFSGIWSDKDLDEFNQELLLWQKFYSRGAAVKTARWRFMRFVKTQILR